MNSIDSLSDPKMVSDLVLFDREYPYLFINNEHPLLSIPHSYRHLLKHLWLLIRLIERAELAHIRKTIFSNNSLDFSRIRSVLVGLQNYAVKVCKDVTI